MFVILWRGVLIALCSLAVMICYPNYPESAKSIVLTWAGISFAITTVLTIIFDILIVGRIKIFNILFDIAIVVVFLYFLLNIFPQLDGKSPYSKLKKGAYPTKSEIDSGLYNLGLSDKENTLQGLESGLMEVSENVNEVKTLIMKENNK